MWRDRRDRPRRDAAAAPSARAAPTARAPKGIGRQGKGSRSTPHLMTYEEWCERARRDYWSPPTHSHSSITDDTAQHPPPCDDGEGSVHCDDQHYEHSDDMDHASVHESDCEEYQEC